MLSVQSVNFRPAFGNYKYADVKDVEYETVNDMPSDEYIYSKEDYSSDKSKLEQQLDEINEVVENTDVPKPIRVAGKIASIGIGAALGFVSMKYGAQGIVNLVKKGAGWVKSLGKKKFVKDASENTQRFFTNIKDSRVGKNVSAFFTGLGERYKNTKFAENLVEFNKQVKEFRPVKFVIEKGTELKDSAAKLVTAKNIEKGAVNLFAVSGGVTGGVTALQEVTKD